jgi:putative aminopeptidase FrvX
MGISYSYKDEYIKAQNKIRSKPYSLGCTELGRLVAETNGQINGTTLQIPSTGYHTPNETASISSIDAVIKLLMSYVA